MTSDQEMQELAEQATEGPWASQGYDDEEHGTWFTGGGEGMKEHAIGFTSDSILFGMSAEQSEKDAAFIAASREWVPETLNRLDQIRELHKPGRVNIPDWKGLYCILCREPYPCPTVRILEGSQQ